MKPELKIGFVFKHPKSGEIIRSAGYTIDELLKTSIEEIQETTCTCTCQPTAESNIVECNCEEYYEAFEYVGKYLVQPYFDKSTMVPEDNFIKSTNFCYQYGQAYIDLHPESVLGEVMSIYIDGYLDGIISASDSTGVWKFFFEEMPKPGPVYIKIMHQDHVDKNIYYFDGSISQRNTLKECRHILWYDEFAIGTKIQLMHPLLRVQKKYIDLLNEEINELIGIAHAQGWKSSRSEEGQDLRIVIEQLWQDDPNIERS